MVWCKLLRRRVPLRKQLAGVSIRVHQREDKWKALDQRTAKERLPLPPTALKDQNHGAWWNNLKQRCLPLLLPPPLSHACISLSSSTTFVQSAHGKKANPHRWRDVKFSFKLSAYRRKTATQGRKITTMTLPSDSFKSKKRRWFFCWGSAPPAVSLAEGRSPLHRWCLLPVTNLLWWWGRGGGSSIKPHRAAEL